MRDPSYDIREAIAITLAGITVGPDFTPVIVYDDIADDNAVYPRIILLDCIGGDTDNSKCGWGGDWFQTIKISDAMTGGVTKNRVDNIADEIFQRLVQTDPTLIISLADFHIWNVQGNAINTQRYGDQTRKYIDKNIRINFSLTEI